MTIHKEGTKILTITFLVLATLCMVIFSIAPMWLTWLVIGASLIIFFLFLQFFRVPKRGSSADLDKILCPADGKVVVIEKVFESEHLNMEVTQVSIFMSPLNVHVNWSPMGGEVSYYKYHPGSYLVAWHPKSSTQNERTTVVVKNEQGSEVLFRQIAGAVARRICCYVDVGARLGRGEQFGFIKFGSRVDIMLPTEWEVNVNIGDKVTGSETVLATIK